MRTVAGGDNRYWPAVTDGTAVLRPPGYATGAPTSSARCQCASVRHSASTPIRESTAGERVWENSCRNNIAVGPRSSSISQRRLRRAIFPAENMWHRVSRFPQDGIRKRYGRIYEGQKETSTSRRSETGSRVGVVKPTQFGSDPSPMIQLDDLPPRSPPPPPPKPTRGPGEKTSSSRDHQDPFTQPHFFDFAPTYMQEYDFDDEAGIYHLIASETRYAEVPLTVLLTQNDPSFPEKPAPKFKPMPQNKPASKGNPMDRPAPTTKEGNPTAKDSSTAKGVPGAQTAPKTQRISINESVNWAQNMYGAQTIPGTNRKKDDHDHEFLGKLRITRIWSLTEHVEYFV